MRIDKYLVEKGFFDSRTKAQEALKSQAVLVNGLVVDKPNFELNSEADIKIVKDVCPYVSRGGLKLKGAIDAFNLDFKDKIVLDIGASTGGFTDCAIKEGAKLIYAVDVGTNQLAPSLRNKKEVISLEQTNILDIDAFPTPLNFLVMDVSFVSIEKLLPAINRFITDDNALICLIKPQFEVGKRFLKNGIVKDKKLHLEVLKNVSTALANYGLIIYKLIPSPILGGSGNKEFLAYIKRGNKSNINLLEVVKG